MLDTAFVIGNPDLCIGCRTCELACVLAHTKKQLGTEEIKSVPFLPRLSVVKTEDISVPIQCRQCEDAPCAEACPEKAIVHRGQAIYVLAEKCVGCKNCLLACPIGAVYLTRTAENAPQKTAYKCDLCAEIPDGPQCVQKCPTKALKIMLPESIASSVKEKRVNAVRNA
ncbi:4Fe-4S dicluster domain-containing protein [Sporomusa acidovorans]|uniref:Hydrogenase-4 component A n=1 Tax=Sporomusa acidovorans (strain ATCC 49682 / DSM 3132 / Mol) TaxID=1123286 RepID=A0ABZ3J0W9_SPOA4|nr:4Fe-4S dicluster domain-containing protein [Sporomusa acidovorans]OZC22463.1 hydrogenase-4 component A [Sporomusa acidovorans DSM 3132]SDE74244.1 electron transport protein HydN [Sporomusa acidovorans]